MEDLSKASLNIQKIEENISKDIKIDSSDNFTSNQTKEYFKSYERLTYDSKKESAKIPLRLNEKTEKSSMESKVWDKILLNDGGVTNSYLNYPSPFIGITLDGSIYIVVVSLRISTSIYLGTSHYYYISNLIHLYGKEETNKKKITDSIKIVLTKLESYKTRNSMS